MNKPNVAIILAGIISAAANCTQAASVSQVNYTRFALDDSFSTVLVDYNDSVQSTGDLTGTFAAGDGASLEYKSLTSTGEVGLRRTAPDITAGFVSEQFSVRLADQLEFSFAGGATSGNVDVSLNFDGAFTPLSPSNITNEVLNFMTVKEYAPGSDPLGAGAAVLGGFELSEALYFHSFDVDPNTLPPEGDQSFVNGEGIAIDYSVEHVLLGGMAPVNYAGMKTGTFEAKVGFQYVVEIWSSGQTVGAGGSIIDALSTTSARIDSVAGGTGSFTSASGLFPGSSNAVAEVPLPPAFIVLLSALAWTAGFGRRPITRAGRYLGARLNVTG